jgi:hypothetical protein
LALRLSEGLGLARRRWGDGLLVANAGWVILVDAEGWDALEPAGLIQPHRRDLPIACF